MATDEDFEMNSSGDDVNNSQLTEEDILDSLFNTCDVENVGKVPVARLIEYLKLTTSAFSENDEDSNLERLFTSCNEENDAEIDIHTYRKVMHTWIDSIRKRHENDSDLDDASSEPTSDGSLCLPKDISILRGTNMDSSVVGTVGLEIDPVEQENQISDLQYQNRKLLEENTKLRQQIDVQEDSISANATEIDKLQKKVKSLQQIADSRQDTIAENEELKSSISKLQEKNKVLLSKITTLEKEKLHYESQRKDLDIKLIDQTSQLEMALSQKQVISKELAECKHELSHAKELQHLQEVQLNERYKEVTALTKQLTDLSAQLKECKREKDEMKHELVQSQHNVISQLPNGSGDATDEVISKCSGSFVCSTPMRQNQSLCMELKGMIGSDRCLPSPLCPKEYHKEYRMDLLPAFNEEDEEYALHSSNSLMEDIANLTEKFDNKQSKLLAEIDSYFRKEECEDKVLSKEKLHSSLHRELADMTEQMASLAIAKDTVDKRVNHLSQSMKKLREENAMLRRMQHDSRSMLVECDRDLQEVVDRRLLILKDKLEEEKNLVTKLRKELEERNRALTKLEQLQNEKNGKFEQEISVLKKLNMELSEKWCKAEDQINCLQDDMRKSEKDVEIEKHRSYELEENLYSNKLARQMDLKEIWRLVQKDIENECHDEKCGENSVNDSSDTMKRKIFNEILSMKSQLHLKDQNPQKMNQQKKKLSTFHSCSCFGTATSSPLVEALTIDFFNGNRPLTKIAGDLNPNEKVLVELGENGIVDSLYDSNLNEGSGISPQNSPRSSTSAVVDLDERSNINDSVDIIENDNFISLEESANGLRRLSYQAAMDNQPNGGHLENYTSSAFVCPAQSFRNVNSNDPVNQIKDQKYSVRNSIVDDNSDRGGLDDYCWNDNMVVFEDDISYSSYSFSHLSYPFQPLRRDLYRSDFHQNEEISAENEQSGDCTAEEEKVDTEISQCPPTRGNDDSDSSLSMTSALANKLERLTLEDSAEVDGLIMIEENKMEQTDFKSTNSQLSKIRQNNLARRREQMKHIVVMPDLKESRESALSGEDPGHMDESKDPDENGEPTPDKEKDVFPSIPDSFLKKHGLAYNKKEDVTLSIHQLTESEVENKFTSLSLAFKTDKLTLEKRLEIQERYRDLSEQNVDKEIKGLRAALETVSHLPECVDSQVQDVLKKIRRHIDVLEQASTKVSSRAEVFGAVQQEQRMSKAIEVMIAHVENLKMAYEREHTELEEARKLIQDGRPFGASFDSESGFASRRSASVCQGMGGLGQKTARRRVSESINPRAGTNGTLSHSVSLDFPHPPEINYGLRRDPREDEDAKSKFQNVIATTVVKNTITNSLRTNSTDQLSLSSREPSIDGESAASKKNSKEEEAFQKGFEQGYKAQIGRDLAQLREQQNNISQSVEHIMDEYDKDNEREEKNLTDTIKDKFWDTVPSWDAASKKLRMTMAGFVFFMALCSIVLSFFPVGQAAMQVHPQYRNIGQPPS